MELIATTYTYTNPYKNKFPFMMKWESSIKFLRTSLEEEELDRMFDKIVFACHPAHFGDIIVERFQYHPRLLIHFEDNRDFMMAKLRFG